MSGTSVLFDAPGPKARRNSRIASVVALVLILGGLLWIVLSLPARFVPEDQAAEIVKAFFNADFEAGRHSRRVDKIKEIETEDFK